MTTAQVVKPSRKSNPNRGSKPGERRGGRTKGTPNRATASIRDIARQYTDEAIEALVTVMRDVDAPSAAVIGAANSILDRAYGKPSQMVEGAGENGEHIVSLITRRVIDASQG